MDARFLDRIQGRIQEAGVVDNQMELSLALFVAPADITVPRCTHPGGGTEAEQGDGLVRRVDEITQLGAGKGLVPEVMVALDQLVPQARFGFFAHALQHQRLEGPGGFLERLSRIAEGADAHALIGSFAAGRGAAR